MKLKLLSIVGLLAALTIITSCGKDDGAVANAPSVSVSATIDGEALANGGDVAVGSVVALEITINAPGGVNGLDVNGTSYSRADLGVEAGETSASITLNAQAPTEAQIGGTINFEIEAVDDLGQTSAVVTFSYTVIAAPSPNAKTYASILVTPPSGDGSTDTFFGIGNGTLYSHNDVTGTADPVSANIDLGYYYGASDNASLAAPAAYPASVFDISAWGTKKDTKLVLTTLTSEEFVAMSSVADVNTSLESITFETSGGNIETNLTIGAVLAFKTADTEAISGFIYIEEINGTDGISDNIKLQFVLNQEAE